MLIWYYILMKYKDSFNVTFGCNEPKIEASSVDCKEWKTMTHKFWFRRSIVLHRLDIVSTMGVIEINFLGRLQEFICWGSLQKKLKCNSCHIACLRSLKCSKNYSQIMHLIDYLQSHKPFRQKDVLSSYIEI